MPLNHATAALDYNAASGFHPTPPISHIVWTTGHLPSAKLAQVLGLRVFVSQARPLYQESVCRPVKKLASQG